jgi:ferredoxin
MYILIVVILVIVLLLFLPLKGKTIYIENTPRARFDERHTMFSRNEIRNDKDKQKALYTKLPELYQLDKDWLQKPGLSSENSQRYSKLTFTAADASFKTVEKLHSLVEGPVNDKPITISPEALTKFVKQWAKKLGAVGVGICKVQPYHHYSVRGRGEYYGKEVDKMLEYGIAFTVEMDEEFLATGPEGPTLMESAQQYLASGTIAVQIAQLLRDLGFEARAHIDGNYEVVAPTVARDAGLGEIGRMGLLMTPRLGPRVRIGVVTTSAPLIVDKRKIDHSVYDFCSICKKCAKVCPSSAISNDDIKKEDDIYRWTISHEKCFNYWCISGTDCGRCMSVCPYSHKDNWLHNFIRWGIKNNFIFRRIAVWGDDLYYGKKPKPKKLPYWLDVKEK